MKKHATTLVLFLVAVGLGVWLWLGRDKVTEGERKRRDTSVFPAWRRDDLSGLTIAHDGETLVLERDAKVDGPWRMASPRVEHVDQAAAERLMTTLEFANVVRKVGDDANLGFDPPRAAGSLTMGSIVFRFVLGGASPRPEGSSYFRIDDGAPFVVSKELTGALLASSDVYRDRSVVPYLSLELARFEVVHPRGGFVVERKNERSFEVGGLHVLASRTALDRVWGALAEMRAEAFPKDADAEQRTREPRLTIRMIPKDPGKPASEIVIGETCPGHPDDVVVLRRTPTRGAACAPRGALEALLGILPDDLVDRRPFSFRHDEVEELRLESLASEPVAVGAPRAIELARRGSGFHLREPDDRELEAGEADAVSELLSMIEQGVASEVLAPGTAARPPFRAIARARVRAGEYEETIEVGPLPAKRPEPSERAADASAEPVTGVILLRRVADDALLVVPAPVARRLVPRATTLRSRVLLGETRRVKRIALRCSTAQDFVDEGSGLAMVDPPGYETDGSIVQLESGLVRGKVLAWVADQDDGSFGFGPGSGTPEADCRVVLAFADENAPVTVRLGADGEGGTYGMIDGRPGVFVAPLAISELARRIYVSHASLRVEPTRIESVKVTSRGTPVVAREPEALRAAAAALFADRAASLGPPNVGPPDVEITIALADGGPAKRITCSAARTTSSGSWRRCATPDVRAVFDVKPALVDAFVKPPLASRAEMGGDASVRDAR